MHFLKNWILNLLLLLIVSAFSGNIRILAVGVEVDKIGFGNTEVLKADPGDPSYPDTWAIVKTNGVFKTLKPIAYRSGTSHSVALQPSVSVVVKVTSVPIDTRVWLKLVLSDGVEFGPIKRDITTSMVGFEEIFNMPAVLTYPYPTRQASTQNITATVKRWDCPNDDPWCDYPPVDATWSDIATTSAITRYLTYGSGSLLDDNKFHTLYHLSCNPGSANGIDSIVLQTFDSWFLNRNVKNHKGQSLVYYPDSNPWPYVQETTAAQLLQAKQGQCYSFLDLFFKACEIHENLSNTRLINKIITPSNYKPHDKFILIKSFGNILSATEQVAYPSYIYADPYYTTTQNAFDICYTVSGTVWENSGLPGQNNSNPGQKVFTNHWTGLFVDLYGKEYILDPSYGGKFWNTPTATDKWERYEDALVEGYGGYGHRWGDVWNDMYARKQIPMVQEVDID